MGDMALYVPTVRKSGGYVPRVLHLIAPMHAIHKTYSSWILFVFSVIVDRESSKTCKEGGM